MGLNRRELFKGAVIMIAGAVVRIPVLAQYRYQSGVYLDQRNGLFHTTVRVVAVTGNTIYGMTAKGPVTFYVDSRSEIWKGTHGSPLAALAVGDMLSVKGRTDGSNRLVATSIYANLVSFDGVITTLNGDIFKVRVQSPSGGAGGSLRDVQVNGSTSYVSKSNKSDLKLGREVHLIGLAREDGTILATRLTIYDEKTHAPVNSENGRTLGLNGKIE